MKERASKGEIAVVRGESGWLGAPAVPPVCWTPPWGCLSGNQNQSYSSPKCTSPLLVAVVVNGYST